MQWSGTAAEKSTRGVAVKTDAMSMANLSPDLMSKNASVPLHSQLADIIRGKINEHEWMPHRKIPSEHELMDLFGLSRGTVRKAICSLVDEGLLVQEHGRGTFVAEPAITHPVGVRPLSFADSLRRQGKAFTTRVLTKRVCPAPPAAANELEIAQGTPVLFMRRVRIVDGETIICQESWSNLSVCPGLEKLDYTKESLFEAVERCSGKKIRYSKICYMARVAGKEHGEYLRCEESAPVLMIEQNIRLEDDSPIEWSFTWFKAGQPVVGNAVQPN